MVWIEDACGLWEMIRFVGRCQELLGIYIGLVLEGCCVCVGLSRFKELLVG